MVKGPSQPPWERAVLVEVLEGKAVILDDMDAGDAGQAQRVAALVVDAHPAVVGDGDGVLRALPRYRDVGFRCLHRRGLDGLRRGVRLLVGIIVFIGIVVFIGIIVLVGIVVLVGIAGRIIRRGCDRPRSGVVLGDDQLVRTVIRVDRQLHLVGALGLRRGRRRRRLFAAAEQADAQRKDQADRPSPFQSFPGFTHTVSSSPGHARVCFVISITYILQAVHYVKI